VILLEGAAAKRSPATVNRHLAAVFDFYDYQALKRWVHVVGDRVMDA
jgi:hypothetical protein